MRCFIVKREQNEEFEKIKQAKQSYMVELQAQSKGFLTVIASESTRKHPFNHKEAAKMQKPKDTKK